MQRTNGNTIAQTTTTSSFTLGTVIVGANAARSASRFVSVESKRSDTGKPPVVMHPWHDDMGWRHADASATAAEARLASRDSYCRRGDLALPPRLWAAWVISQSLCG
jgi:hypothetical protein